ncbi:MAG: glycosyltransferase [Anaerolineae bacterium]|nr:glycosyltransferase [Anaerolineae bacterium]
MHTHLVHAETYAIPAARLAGVRVVVNTCHNDDPFRRHPAMRARSWALWRLAHGGIAISEAIRRFLITVERAPASRIQAIYYGLPLPPLLSVEPGSLHATLNLPPSARLMGSVCRLVEQKGVAYALEAFAQLAPRYPDLHYVIVGDGALRGR